MMHLMTAVRGLTLVDPSRSAAGWPGKAPVRRYSRRAKPVPPSSAAPMAMNSQFAMSR
jgi:hypothetical protein